MNHRKGELSHAEETEKYRTMTAVGGVWYNQICEFLEESLNREQTKREQTKDEWIRIFGRIRYKDRQNQKGR